MTGERPAVRDPAILNWQRIDDRITTSGQPSEPQLAEIAALGVRTVINLGLHSHERALPDEAASVAALGMRYVHVPVAFDAPQEADYARFVTALDEAQGAPVHVHCIVNARVSAFFYRYRRERGLGEEDARAELERVWRPGAIWARFLGLDAPPGAADQYRGRDY